jgi:hypothetical protein
MQMVDYTTPADTAQLSFRADDNNAPSSSVIGTLQSPTSGSDAFGAFVFTATSAITLEANTTYWMVITSPDSGNAFAWVRSSNSPTPTGLFTFGIQAISYNSGANWQEGSNGPHSFSIEGSAVPEPGVILLSILGLTALVLLRRRPSRSS